MSEQNLPDDSIVEPSDLPEDEIIAETVELSHSSLKSVHADTVIKFVETGAGFFDKAGCL